jgi:hypothetical protein
VSVAARRRRVKRVLNCVPSQETKRDWRFENAEQAGLLAAPAAIPASKDLRETWWKIGNQESTGSCVGWAAGDGVLRWHLVKARELEKNEKLSIRFLWMAAKETDQFIKQPTTFIEVAGTSLKAALDVARKYGVVREKILPFDPAVLFPGEEETFYARAAKRKIDSYFNLSLSTGHSLESWRTWIATKGPILTRLDVDRTWYDAKANKGNLDLYRRPPRPAGHAVCLVGYTPDRFIVRNSWGTVDWGDKGFGYASLAYAEDAFTEAYGVSV